MENNQNTQNSNWQQALNELQQPETQPQTAPQTQAMPQPQMDVNPQMYAQPQQVNNAQPQMYAQPQQVNNVQPQFAQADTMTAPVYDAANFAVLPITKKKNKLVPILIIILAAAILIGGAIFVYFKFFAGSSYEKIERSYFSGLSDQLDTVAPNKDIAQNMQITISAGKSLTGGTELAPTVLSLDCFTDIETKNSMIEMIYSAGSEKLLSAIMYSNASELLLQIPELSEIFINVSVDDIMNGNFADIGNLGTATLPTTDSAFGGSSTLEGTQAILDYIENLDPKVIESILGSVVDAYFEVYGNSAVKSGGTFTFGDISAACDQYKIDFTGENVMDFASVVLNKLKSNQDVIDLLQGFGLNTSIFDTLTNYVDQAKDQLSDADKNQVIFTMSVFVKGDEMLGRTLSAGSDEITIATAANVNGKFAFGFSANTAGEEALIAATGTTDGKKYDGKLVATSEGNTTEVATFSLTVDEYINGNITITIPDADMSAGTVPDKVVMTIASSEESAKFDFDIQAKSESMMKLTVEAKEIPFKEFTMPVADDSNSFEITDTSSAAAQQFATDVQNNINTLMSKLTSLEMPDLLAFAMTAMPQQPAGASGAEY